MLTQDEVIWGFRYCLGRDPESEDIVATYRNFGTWDELRNALLHCPQFENNIADSGLLATRETRERFVTGLYETLFNRMPDEQGFEANVRALEQGMPPHALVAGFLNSTEFEAICKRRAFPAVDLPDLRATYPSFYRGEGENAIYIAADDDRVTFMENMIKTCGYYDRFGAWSISVDQDKKNIAQLVECFGAESCLEVGCFNGPVLSLLQERGIEIAGIEPSHLAFLLAFPNVRKHLLWGDLLSVKLDRKFDCIIALDVLEHVSPLSLHEHIGRIKAALAEHGVVIVNSPMFGHDEVFGTVFEQNVSEWHGFGDQEFFRHWPCDSLGWPMHGHMVWASPAWWTTKFKEQGLVRIQKIEAALQNYLSNYFTWAPARKSLFVLGHSSSSLDVKPIISAIGERIW